MLRMVSAFVLVVGVGIVLAGAGYYAYLRFHDGGLTILNAAPVAVEACLIVLCGIAAIIAGLAVGVLAILEEIKDKLPGGMAAARSDS